MFIFSPREKCSQFATYSSVFGVCYRLNCVHPDIEVLTPRTSQCDLIWKQDHCRLHNVTWVGLTNMTLSLYKGEMWAQDRHIIKMSCEREGRNDGGVSKSQATEEISSKLPEVRKISFTGYRWSQPY
jgi:hypothetical protein